MPAKSRAAEKVELQKDATRTGLAKTSGTTMLCNRLKPSPGPEVTKPTLPPPFSAETL